MGTRLRKRIGGQLTEKEGATLRAIEANRGKSKAVNKRLNSIKERLGASVTAREARELARVKAKRKSKRKTPAPRGAKFI
jgi:hypothetical protein